MGKTEKTGNLGIVSRNLEQLGKFRKSKGQGTKPVSICIPTHKYQTNINSFILLR